MEIKNISLKERITAIDALRAIAIFGIVLAHVQRGFGFPMSNTLITPFDNALYQGISIFIINRAHAIFSILFGISFYLILKNPNYSSGKFVWRCVLLMMFGLFNKLIYTPDVLITYGFLGIFLCLFRNTKTVYLFVLFCIFFCLNDFLSQYKLGNWLFGQSLGSRYFAETSFKELITYRYAVIDSLRSTISSRFFRYFALFLLGYCIAKVGVIDNISQYNTKLVVFILLVLTIIFAGIKVIFALEYNFLILFCALFYMSLFLWLYDNVNVIKKFFKYLEPFGKCGLSNYSLINILGVLTMANFGLGLINYSFSVIVCIYVCMYVCMVVLSYYWIKYFKYGLMEWLWRCATERKLLNNKQSKDSIILKTI